MTSTAQPSTSPVRTIDGIELPAPGRWEIDPDHSNVEFIVRHAFTKIRGRLNVFSGNLAVTKDSLASTIEVTIDPASVDTGNQYRDDHLRSSDFFDVENHPLWTFTSTRIHSYGDDGLIIDGDLTIRGITKPVNLVVDYLGVMGSTPGGEARASFSATTKISRHDFGVSYDDITPGGLPFIGRSVTIDLQVELVHRRDADHRD